MILDDDSGEVITRRNDYCHRCFSNTCNKD